MEMKPLPEMEMKPEERETEMKERHPQHQCFSNVTSWPSMRRKTKMSMQGMAKARVLVPLRQQRKRQQRKHHPETEMKLLKEMKERHPQHQCCSNVISWPSMRRKTKTSMQGKA